MRTLAKSHAKAVRRNSVRPKKVCAVEAANFVVRHGRELNKREARTRRTEYEDFAAICEYARGLAADMAEWAVFCRHSCWSRVKGRPKEHARDHAGRYLFRLYFAEFADGSSRASHHWRVARALLGQGIQPRDMARHLTTNGGFKGALRGKPATAANSDDGDQDVLDNRAGPKRTLRLANLDALEVELREESLAGVLGLVVGAKATLMVQRVAGDGDWKRFRAIKVRISDQ